MWRPWWRCPSANLAGWWCLPPAWALPGAIDTRCGPSPRRALRPLRHLDLQAKLAVRDLLPRALERSRVLFVYDEEHLDSGPHEVGKVRALLARLPEGSRGRFELRLISGRGLARFGSIEVQESLLDTVLQWAEEHLPRNEEAGPDTVASHPSRAAVSPRGVQ